MTASSDVPALPAIPAAERLRVIEVYASVQGAAFEGREQGDRRKGHRAAVAWRTVVENVRRNILRASMTTGST